MIKSSTALIGLLCFLAGFFICGMISVHMDHESADKGFLYTRGLAYRVVPISPSDK